MKHLTTDIAIIGAGMAGASLAAMIGQRARVLLLEAESQPGFHSTGRSAAFWAESYGGVQVQPLTTASGHWLANAGLLSPRGCIHIAEEWAHLGALAGELDAGRVSWHALARDALAAAIPGLRPRFAHGIVEPSCQDIDVAGLHMRFLQDARRSGAEILCDAAVRAIERRDGRWHVKTGTASIAADVIVNAAGAWASPIARLAGASSIPIQPYRRTIVQLSVEPMPPADLPLIMEARGHFYFKPEAGGRLWLSPHDETAVDAHDVAAEDLDQAIAIDRLMQAVDWRILRRERAWAGLRSFAPDRLPVYGFDAQAPGFFWCAGQGGFGIQTAPAAAMIAAALLLKEAPVDTVAHIDPTPYAPARFDQVAG